MDIFIESKIEAYSMNELKELEFSCIPGPYIAPEVEAKGRKMVKQ
jgi:hypothetical protein